MPLILRQND
jgi:hypothetical protein